MKILLLLSGYPGNINSVKDTSNISYKQVNFDRFYKGFNYFKKLLKGYETKVICSIWDNIGSKEVNNLYKPEILSNYDQKKFQNNFNNQFKNLENYRVNERQKWFITSNTKDESFVPTSRYASQLFIRQEVCKKAFNYIQESKFRPNIIILSRFDIGTRGGIPIRNPLEINTKISTLFEINQKNPFIVIPECNQLNLGYPDMWFYLNKEALLKMQKLYDVYIGEIFKKDSLYINYLTNGWPSSQWFNLKNKYDSRQFSNLVLSKKYTKKLMRYPIWESPNIHMFYKYFISLYDKPLKIYFSKKNQAYIAMFKYLGYKFSIYSALKEIINSLKIRIKIYFKNLYNIIALK